MADQPAMGICSKPTTESFAGHIHQNPTLSNKTKQSGLSGVRTKSIVAAEKPRRAVTLRFPNKLDFVGINATGSASTT
jgi:hypothetical protein